MPVEKSFMLNEPSTGPVPAQTLVGASTLSQGETAAGLDVKIIAGEPITVPLFATTVSQTIFVADDNYVITGVQVVADVLGGAGATVTVEALTGVVANGSGVAQLTAALVVGSTGTAHAVVAGTLIAAPTVIAKGSRFGIVMAGTLTALVGLITVSIKRV